MKKKIKKFLQNENEMQCWKRVSNSVCKWLTSTRQCWGIYYACSFAWGAVANNEGGRLFFSLLSSLLFNIELEM